MIEEAIDSRGVFSPLNSPERRLLYWKISLPVLNTG
jgi:hypothetical protein